MLVAVVIFWPESVTAFLDKETAVNTDDVHIEMQIEDLGSDPVTPPAAQEPTGSVSDVVGGEPDVSVPPPQVEIDPTQAVKDAL